MSRLTPETDVFKRISHENLVAESYNFAQQFEREYERARKKFGMFDNYHEAIAVIREEYLELEKLCFGKDYTTEDVIHMLEESTQLAAMCFALRIELLL